MNARRDRAHNRAEPGKQPLGFTSKIMGALIKPVCKHWFVRELVAGADASADDTAPTPFASIDLGGGDRPGRPVSWRECPLCWAS
jgi:hypothetical protein